MFQRIITLLLLGISVNTLALAAPNTTQQTPSAQEPPE